MISLFDTSIVIPVRIDHPDRLANLETLLRFFSTFFSDTEIIIVESAITATCQILSNRYNAKYYFISDDGPFQKCKLINFGVKQSSREIIAMHDTDVLFIPEAIHALVEAFRKEPTCAYGLPYNGIFLNIEEPLKSQLIQTWDFSLIPYVQQAAAHQKIVPGVTCINPVSVGGSNYFRKEILIQLGGFNEKFITCVWEDYEIEARFIKMGYPPAIIKDANALHLHHARVPDTQMKYFERFNRNEYERICTMTPSELREYIERELKNNLDK